MPPHHRGVHRRRHRRGPAGRDCGLCPGGRPGRGVRRAHREGGPEQPVRQGGAGVPALPRPDHAPVHPLHQVRRLPVPAHELRRGAGGQAHPGGGLPPAHRRAGRDGARHPRGQGHAPLPQQGPVPGPARAGGPPGGLLPPADPPGHLGGGLLPPAGDRRPAPGRRGVLDAVEQHLRLR